MQLILSPTFKRTIKKLHPNQKKSLDDAVRAIQVNPHQGETKRGDLSGVYIFKFKMNQLDWLLAYEVINEEIILLLLVGPHENFYRDLKR